MATDTYSVSANTTVATQVVFASDPPTSVLIINTSLTGTIFISESNTARVSDASGLVPIAPNGSVVVDGTNDFFVVTSSATPITVATVDGGLATFLGLTQGGGSLAIPSIFSPNFLHGVSGWTINKDGSAEFNNLNVRGTTLTGTLTAGNTLIINQSGWFLYAGTPTGPTAAGTFTKVGGLIQSSGSTITIDPVNINDTIILHVISNGTAPPSGVSGGNCTWVQIGNTFNGTVNVGFIGAVYQGTAIATGSAVATVSFAGTPTTIRNAAQEWASSTGTCMFITQNTLDSAGTNTMPAITATAGELYSIFEFDNVTSTAGTTPGYTYEIDSNGNCLCFNGNCTAGIQAPVMGDSTCAFGIAVLLSAGGGINGNLIIAGASAAGSDGVGNAFVEGLNVFAGAIAGATAMFGNSVVINSSGLFVYNGAAIPANLQLSITPGGAITTNAPVLFEKRASTPASDPNGGATAYSTNGSLQVVDGQDNNVYYTQTQTRVLRASIGFSSTTPSDTGLHMPVSANRTYRIAGIVFIQAPAAAPGLVQFELAGPGGTTGQIGFLLVRATVTATQNVAPNVNAGIFQTAVNNQYLCYIDGIITTTAAGTAALFASVNAAATSFSLEPFSSLSFSPSP
jgi:hypothetical protein